MATSPRSDIERELRRVVDRLNSVTLTRLEPLADPVHEAAVVLAEHTRRCDPSVPDAPVPRLAPHGLGALVAVLGEDYLAVTDEDPDSAEILDVLVTLRRGLP